MADKLLLYNRALAHLKEERLASLTERRGPRFKLDDQWDDAVAYCLEKGFWKFATRSVMLNADASASPAFGYRFAYTKPDDWVRTIQIATDDRFNGLLSQYNEENGYWYCDWDVIFLRYISDHADFGMDLSLWPQSFNELIALRLAGQAGPGISNDKELVAFIRKEEKAYRVDAQSLDAMGDPPQRPPAGSWVRGRRGFGMGFISGSSGRN